MRFSVLIAPIAIFASTASAEAVAEPQILSDITSVFGQATSAVGSVATVVATAITSGPGSIATDIASNIVSGGSSVFSQVSSGGGSVFSQVSSGGGSVAGAVSTAVVGSTSSKNHAAVPTAQAVAGALGLAGFAAVLL